MKKVLAVLCLVSMFFSLTACTGNPASRTSEISAESFVEESSMIDYLPADDAYLTDEELDVISNKYFNHLYNLEKKMMSVAVIEDFEKNGSKFKNTSKYGNIKFRYELAASMTGDCNGVTNVESSKIDNVLDLSFRLNDNKDILCDYKNKSGVKIQNIYVTWVPYDENEEVLCLTNNNSSYALTLRIEGDIDNNETGKKKFETCWNESNISSCRLKYVLIVFEENIAIRFTF